MNDPQKEDAFLSRNHDHRLCVSDALQSAEEVCTRADTGRRGFRLLEPGEVRRINPALRGKFLAALHCSRDGAVESRQALPAIRAALRLPE